MVAEDKGAGAEHIRSLLGKLSTAFPHLVFVGLARKDCLYELLITARTPEHSAQWAKHCVQVVRFCHEVEVPLDRPMDRRKMSIKWADMIYTT